MSKRQEKTRRKIIKATGIAPELSRFGNNRGFYLFVEATANGKVMRVYDQSTGKMLASIFRDPWRVLLGDVTRPAEDGFDAIRIVASSRGPRAASAVAARHSISASATESNGSQR